jgi:uncharacterized RDD family membrane protein YckC
MKCPKCSYLGFETGNQCRNCGYDFSLIGTAALEKDLPLRPPIDHPPTAPRWSQAVDEGLGAPTGDTGPVAQAGGQGHAAPGRDEDLPLFQPGGGDDTPLITIAPPPRVPLAVRRTPVTPRRVSRVSPAPADSEPRLEFADEPSIRQSPALPASPSPAETAGAESRAGRRVLAVALDAAILLTIDATVVYLTLRIAGVPTPEWRALPLLPLLAFLGLVKMSYHTVFTAYGGQTIGKMATGIRVVGETGPVVDLARAIGRSAMAGASVLLLGLPLVPWLVGREGRTLHDRLAHTRVVAQRAH